MKWFFYLEVSICYVDLSASNLPIGLIPEVMTSNVIVWPASEVILEDGTFKN